MPVTGPNLDDPQLFAKRPAVPILDVHTRGSRVVDEQLLRLVAANSNRRAAAGEFGLLLIGHTTDDGPETAQPPLVGFVRNYAMGSHDGRPCIMADLFYDKDHPEAFEFPRRSVEVLYSNRDPAMNYVDAVALLRRMPERPLGLMTYRGKIQIERYSMADEPITLGVTEADIPVLQEYMKNNRILDWATGISMFLRARSTDTNNPADDSFTQADIMKMQKYAQARKIDLTQPGAYERTLVRYKADRKAGTLDVIRG